MGIEGIKPGDILEIGRFEYKVIEVNSDRLIVNVQTEHALDGCEKTVKEKRIEKAVVL